MMSLPAALTIAGSDPSGGAGIQADLKTFHQLGVYGMSVITLITAQNTRGVTRIETLAADLVGAQLRAVMEDIEPKAIKTGALGNREIIKKIANGLKITKSNLVVDPVIASTNGRVFLDDAALKMLKDHLLPIATLITPNIPEAAALTGRSIRTLEDMQTAARNLCALGASAALVKGGHRSGNAVDVFFQGGDVLLLEAERVQTPHTHGTGCTLSAAITARLALGDTLEEAVRFSKDFITHAIAAGPKLGRGRGPVGHHAST